MTERMANKLSFGRKLLLVGVGIALIAGPVVLGLVNAPQIRAQSTPTTAAPLPSFEVASIKPSRSGDDRFFIMMPPGRFTTTGATTKYLITFAYNVKDSQLSGGPSWISSEKYDIQAKVEDSLFEKLHNLPPHQEMEQIQLRVQSLLADRFKLKVSRAAKELPVYALVIAKNGPKLQESKPGDTYPNGIKRPDGRPAGVGNVWMTPGHLTGQGIPINFVSSDDGAPPRSLVQLLSLFLGRTVLDETGLKGSYDINLQWTPDQRAAAMPMGPSSGADAAPPPDSSGPSIFTAIQEQLGLKLEPAKAPVEVLVVDAVQRPGAN
jgi:uncharacterized protein (TIGR03435 family)